MPLAADLANPNEDYVETKKALAGIKVRKVALEEEVERLRAEMHADRPLSHAHDVLRLLADADDDQRHTLRLRLRSLISELVESIQVKPEKHFGRVYCVAQLYFVSGLSKQVIFGGGMKGGTPEQAEPAKFGVDLRDRKAARKPILRAWPN